MQQRFASFIIRNEKLIPVFIFLLFLAASVPGVNWGVPALWNPDEMIWRVDSALRGEIIFDETEPDFNYPSLPKYVMFGIGKIVYGMGGTPSDFYISARVFSALLGAVAGVLVYFMARTIGMDVLTSALAGLLYVSSGVAAANGRFAHNDLYLQLFSVLCVYFVIKYQFTKARLWLYGSFFSVGLAASSKFTGGSLLLVPLFVFVFMNWSEVRKNWLQSFEMLFIGGALSFGGYILGTPKALLWMAYYFKRVIPALQRYPQYGFNSGTPIGLFGQWPVFEDAVGTFAYYIFILCFIWFAAKLILWKLGKLQMDETQAQAIMILAATVLLFDLPFMISINYIPRYFIPFVPFLSIMGALFIKEIVEIAKAKNWKYVPQVVSILLVVGITYSMLRLASTALLFMNDARMPASEFVADLPGEGKTIEYTLYPPIVNKKQFAKAYNYPVFFLKYPTDVVPTGGRYEYNQGEAGLIDRETDYLIIDTLTYGRLYTESVCVTNPVECDFFKRLVAGEIKTFRLMKEFTYTLPPWLPDISLSAVNPEVRIYERVR
ncbi:phospholipid carrier-dependent glycosyltransferase [Candidatus Villigracilis affinis]|uniref:phospholipid carrier-dependent glycosyltransferase n=1 Tax=Candidatus Villigracilis affinis TaxID=3140682 RepID=UPI001D96B68A|nr:phospholipid carrier-dependent glycosyltransferase [Anaerolineales bacterium]